MARWKRHRPPPPPDPARVEASEQFLDDAASSTPKPSSPAPKRKRKSRLRQPRQLGLDLPDGDEQHDVPFDDDLTF